MVQNTCCERLHCVHTRCENSDIMLMSPTGREPQWLPLLTGWRPSDEVQRHCSEKTVDLPTVVLFEKSILECL